MSHAYYNENDPKAAAWLRELIKHGHIAPGEVDERSIEDVEPSDLKGYTQCHFFAGIGGWSYALRLAGWPDDEPVWTGSCPCQPFSAAGKGKGFADERHLWPTWQWLIEQCRPAHVFGEQVASPAGKQWFDLVSTDLEGLGYAVAAADLCAAGVGAPHIRQRLYWVADRADVGRREERALGGRFAEGDRAQGRSTGSVPGGADRDSLVGHARSERSRRHAGTVPRAQAGAEGEVRCESDQSQPTSPWADCEWIWCRDGKYRPVEPGTFPLAHGVPGRVGLLRGYGNAIVPQVAAAFIQASGLMA